ncbi:MAG TPA: ABC transporter permease, partial [Mycobacteriales bacterium]|nr:ABC transporter permease [Mycobacteriales bacterium]
TVVAKMFEFLFALPVVVAFGLYYQHGANWRLVLFPLGLLLQFMLTFGVALMVAPLTVLANDVQRVVRIILRVLFYLTPVLYSLNHVAPDKEWISATGKLNPMAGILSLYRAGLWSQDMLSWQVYLLTTAVCVLTLALGLFVFRRFEGTVLKEI